MELLRAMKLFMTSKIGLIGFLFIYRVSKKLCSFHLILLSNFFFILMLNICSIGPLVLSFLRTFDCCSWMLGCSAGAFVVEASFFSLSFFFQFILYSFLLFSINSWQFYHAFHF